jgi:hypothetical protein
MKAMILKEWREHLKWVPLPGLVILLVFSIEKPEEPMPWSTAAYFYCLTIVVFAAALGFLQIVFEAHGDKRSLLLHRPLGPSRIFLAKALAGVSLYLLALGIPIVCLETWKARPGNMPAPYHWQMSLPWLADILSGLVFYFAGMLAAQRAARWYGSRGLALAGAFFCSCLVWALPEFWQALVAIGIIGSLVGVAAWGSFSAGGEYATQPRLAKAGLAMTFLAALVILSMLGKQMIGEWSDSGFRWEYGIDRQGRALVAPMGALGPMGPYTVVSGQELPDHKGPMFPAYNGQGDSSFEAPATGMETPLHGSYRGRDRFYVEYENDSKPGNEVWYFDQVKGRLVGYDKSYHQLVGRFGPDGFTPAGVRPGERFHGELRYRTRGFFGSGVYGQMGPYLVCSDVVYTVDFARRTIRTLFTPAAGETVTFGNACVDLFNREWKRVFVSTDKSLHVLTEDGAPVLSVPRVQYRQKDRYIVALGGLENPERYFASYGLTSQYYSLAEPAEFKSTPVHFHEYDTSGRELAHRGFLRLPYPADSYVNALFGAVTPMTEAAALVSASRFLRWDARLKGSIGKPVLLLYLENIRYYIPGTSPFEVTPSGLVPSYLALIVLSGAVSAMGCWLLARRYAFSRGRSIMWALVGFFFGWVGWLLMLVLQEWPARVSCPTCRQLRLVTRDRCEHCGCLHAPPASDGTEIFEWASALRQISVTAR